MKSVSGQLEVVSSYHQIVSLLRTPACRDRKYQFPGIPPNKCTNNHPHNHLVTKTTSYCNKKLNHRHNNKDKINQLPQRQILFPVTTKLVPFVKQIFLLRGRPPYLQKIGASHAHVNPIQQHFRTKRPAKILCNQ
jgi:hypothetical protein